MRNKIETPIQYGIGIDQGLANIGFAILSNAPSFESNPHPLSKEYTTIESGVLTTSSDDELAERLKEIFEFLKAKIEKYNCQFISCEKLFHNEKQKNGRNKSASIVRTNMVSGLIYLLGGLFNIPVFEFVPGTVKKHITGNGQATKEEMIETISKWLKINFKRSEEHRADAIGICIAGFIKYPKHMEELFKQDVYFIKDTLIKENIRLEKERLKYQKEFEKYLKKLEREKASRLKKEEQERKKQEKIKKQQEKALLKENNIIKEKNKIYNKIDNDNGEYEEYILDYRFSNQNNSK